MKILQIANKAIYPPDGGTLAILNLAKGYVENGNQVHLLNMITHKHINKFDEIKEGENKSFQITGVKINTGISIFKLIINLITSTKPYISERFISIKFRNKLVEIIKNETFDIIQIEGLYVLQYIDDIRKIYKGKILYRSHNLEHLIWERNSVESKSFVKKYYFKITGRRLLKLEKTLLNRYDYIVPITDSDLDIYKKLGNNKPAIIAPFGLDLNSFKAKHIKITDSKQSINYIGALDWIPNQQGLIWFIESCLPEIIKSFPEIKLNIAGRNAPKWLIEKFNHKSIKYFGEVSNAYDFIQYSGPVIVPLFSGSGMRVKIIECMALKKTIIATNVAAEGIECRNNENILLADSAPDFSQLVLIALKNKAYQKEIGENAFRFVNEKYNFTKIASNIIDQIG